MSEWIKGEAASFLPQLSTLVVVVCKCVYVCVYVCICVDICMCLSGGDGRIYPSVLHFLENNDLLAMDSFGWGDGGGFTIVNCSSAG